MHSHAEKLGRGTGDAGVMDVSDKGSTFVKLTAVVVGCALLFGGIFGFIDYRHRIAAEAMASATAPAAPVTMAIAEAREWTETIAAIGTLEAPLGTDISPSYDGLVDAVLFESGQQVRKGEALLRMDSDVEAADLRSAEAELAYAATELERARALSQTKTISAAALDLAESTLEVRAAQVARLKALIEKKTIVAPFDGVLGIRQVDVGQYLEAGATIVNIQDLSAMLANFAVSQKHLGELHLGQALVMTIDAYPDRRFAGEITAIAPLVEWQSGMVAMQGRFENPEGALRPGMFARVAVMLPGKNPVVVVPRRAVAYSLYGNTVYLLEDRADAAGAPVLAARRVVVQTGDSQDGWTWILAGVGPGDRVVTSGQLRLGEGTPVSLSEDAPLAAPADLPLD